MNILDKLLDLKTQATKERSHYYVSATVDEAIDEINDLQTRVRLLEQLYDELLHTMAAIQIVIRGKR